MARPQPWRLVADAYPAQDMIQTRFQDLDPMGHLNNVAYAALFETARVRFNRRTGGFNREGGFRAVVARSEINYLAEGRFSDEVMIATGIGRIGTRSWDILAAMFQDDRAIATCDVTIVMTGDAAAAIPADFRDRIEVLRVREG